MKVLDSLMEGDKYTRQLLEEFNDFSIHEVLKHCEEKGFVKRVKRANDKRVYNSITAKGRDVLQRYRSVMKEMA